MENFNEIYTKHYDRVLNVINFRIKNTETAEDLAAEVFVKIHENLSSFDPSKSTIGTWIGVVTKNCVIDYFRKRKLDSKSMSDLSDDEGKELVVYSDNYTPETNMINNQLGENIMNAICSLPTNQMNVIDLFMIEDRSHEEVAELLDMPIGTVKATIHRAKEALRNKLSNL